MHRFISQHLGSFYQSITVGMLALFFTFVGFRVPTEGITTTFTEVVLIIGLFHMPGRIWWAISAAILSLGIPDGGSFWSNLISHLLAVQVCLGFVQRYMVHGHSSLPRQVGFSIVLVAGYYTVLVPATVGTHLWFLGYGLSNFAAELLATTKAVWLEYFTTSLSVFLYTMAHHASQNLKQANNDLLQTNQRLAESLQLIEEKNEALTIAGLAAEESNRLKTSFLQNLSHELRTPLNGIVLGTEMAFDPHLSETERSDLQREVQLQAERLVQMIDKVLMLSRLEAEYHQGLAVAAPIDWYALEGQLFQYLEGQCQFLGKAHLQRQLSLEAAQGFYSPYLHAEQLYVVLQNLIENAVKFTPEGYVHVAARTDGHRLSIQVHDTGPGLPEHERQRAFEAFYKTPQPHYEHSGVGVGLALANKLTRRMGGQLLWADNRPHGSVVSVQFDRQA